MANSLIDCTTFFVDNNIFINIGLDPDFLLNCVICVSNNTQYVKMSVEFYKSLNIGIKNINFLLPSHLLLDEFKLVSIEEFNGDNVLSIKCLEKDQTVQLTEENVSRFLHLSDAIEEVIQVKTMYTRSTALLQACEISMYLGKEMPLPKDTKISEVEDYLTRIDVQELKGQLQFTGLCLIADLKMKAVKQLARGWLSSSTKTESEVNRLTRVERKRAKVTRRLSFHL
ncbi:uncharacterized protein LOC115034986 [Acyrthosiphon pisum]|uniref:Uncharacterized protein n=1 Tax=Acyrthosiphon pisum TaxID=7029 RepID=A0A8R2JW79_ACYPI|nr:uncharacterized protein LOC115034986 [Acyrthosiphon pisum]